MSNISAVGRRPYLTSKALSAAFTAWFTGPGRGRFAVEAVCGEVRARGGKRAYVTWKPRPGGPERFYLKLGFRPTGEQSGGEIVAVLEL